VNLKANTINEAWFMANQACYKHGYEFVIQRGSYAGQRRKQLESMLIEIVYPETRPLATSFKSQQFSSDADIVKYFYSYLCSDEKQKGEDYTYGNRIYKHLETLIEILKKTPDTNQAVIEVAQPDDILLDSPPCLRSLSWKYVNGKINLASYWRSFDLTNGLPTNLGGLQLLNEYVCGLANLKTGKLIAFSDGAHIYDHWWDLFA
jgi:thymidylate synthase